MNRQVKIILIAGAAVLLMALAGLAVLLGVNWFKDSPPTIVSTVVTPADSTSIGETITATITVKLPWNRRPVRAPKWVTPKGVTTLGDPRTHVQKIKLGAWYWQTTARMRATDFLADRTVKGTFFFTADRHGESSGLPVTFTLPEIVPRHLKASTPLVAAGAVAGQDVTASRHIWSVIGLFVLILIIIVILIAVFRGKGLLPSPPPPPTIWDIAERELSALESALPMEADLFFLKLTDILRHYIEVRFNCPATERTTPEFLNDTRHADWLTDDQRDRLTAVLTAADQVKFARADATLRDMSQALDGAGRFVGETRRRLEPSEQAPVSPAPGAVDTAVPVTDQEGDDS